MSATKTTVLTTEDRISHALVINGPTAKVTACKIAFVAWVTQNGRHGIWHGTNGPLPALKQGSVDCMTCMVKAEKP